MSNFWISFGIGLLIVFGALALAVPGVLLSLRAKRPPATSSNQTTTASTTTTTTTAASSTNSSSSIIKSGLLGWAQLILVTVAVLLVLNTWVIPGKIRAFLETIFSNIAWPTFSWSDYLPTSMTWTGWIVGLAIGAILFMAGEDILPGKLGKFSKAIAVAIVALMLLYTPTEVYRFFVGSRPRLVATQGTTSAVLPNGVPASVIVPACGGKKSWSKAIQIPAGWNITSAWNMDTVQAAWRENGEWKQFEGKYLSGSFDAVKYCAKNSSYAGEEMFLTWTVR